MMLEMNENHNINNSQKVIEQQLFELITKASFTNVQADQIQLDSFLNDIGIDSLAFMELIVYIEEKFGVVVNDNDLLNEPFDTVQSVRDFIFSRV